MKLTAKNFRKLFTVNFIENNFEIFSGKFEKKILQKIQKKWGQGRKLNNAFRKIRHYLSLDFDVFVEFFVS